MVKTAKFIRFTFLVQNYGKQRTIRVCTCSKVVFFFLLSIFIEWKKIHNEHCEHCLEWMKCTQTLPIHGEEKGMKRNTNTSSCTEITDSREVGG